MKKSTLALVIGILTISLLLAIIGFSEEKLKDDGNRDDSCLTCTSDLQDRQPQKRTKPGISCSTCSRKPCSATRSTWLQLYRKITGSDASSQLPPANKEQKSEK